MNRPRCNLGLTFGWRQSPRTILINDNGCNRRGLLRKIRKYDLRFEFSFRGIESGYSTSKVSDLSSECIALVGMKCNKEEVS